MKVVNCIPIDENTGLDTLSYFSQKDIPINSLVAVPLRNKLIPAVVISKSEVTDIKSVIRTNTYGLKKVARIIAPEFFSTAFMEAASRTSTYFASRTGAVLSSLLPTKIPTLISPIRASSVSSLKNRKTPEKLVLQNADKERFVEYKNLLRQRFSSNTSVVALVPTITDGDKLKTNLEKGIEKYCFFFHSGLSKKQLAISMAQMMDTKHPVLVIVTGGYLSFMPHDTSLLIVERESSSAYKTQCRPFMDFRYFAETLAESSGISIILGDELITLLNRHRVTAEILDNAGRPRLRAETQAKTLLVDMRRHKPTFTGNYTVLSQELIEALNEARADNSHSFLYVARKGLYPNTVCGDCGSVLSCKICSAALVLHNIQDQKIYICHRCGEKRDAHTRCDRCDSWKLVTLGIGSEKVVEELKAVLPQANIFRLDRDSAKNRKAALTIIREYERSPSAILVGTELAIPYLEPSLAMGAIVSIDALFSLPEYKINEKIMGVLTKIRSTATKKFIVQTRHTESPIIEMGVSGNLAGFYEYELTLRKKFGYPPFATFIKITIKGEPGKIAEEMKKLESALEPQKIHIFPALESRKGGRFGLNGLIKLPSGIWPDERIANILKTLPPNWSINVEPESLL